MGTNYYWYLDQELLQSANDMNSGSESTFAINVPDIVKTVYQTAAKHEYEANKEQGRWLAENDSVIKDFSYETGPVKVKALHIGKKSWGWCFGMHVYPGMIESYKDWLDVFSYGTIRNEYHDHIRKEEMIKIIDVDGKDGKTADHETKWKRADAKQDQYSGFDPEYWLWRRKLGYDWVAGNYKAVDYCLGHFS